MYKSLSENITNKLNSGWAVLPNETKVVTLKKLPWKSFESWDYRISNPINIENDRESILTGDVSEQEGKASYLMGFMVMKDIKQMSEVANMSLSTQTRYKNRMFESLVNVLARSEIRKTRGNRSVFVSNEIENLQDFNNPELLNSINWNNSFNQGEWVVVKFLISTTVMFNNYRVKIGIGNKQEELELVKNDVEYRFKNEVDNLVAKMNNKLMTPISEDIYAGMVLVNPEKLLTDVNLQDNLLDYLV